MLQLLLVCHNAWLWLPFCAFGAPKSMPPSTSSHAHCCISHLVCVCVSICHPRHGCSHPTTPNHCHHRDDGCCGLVYLAAPIAIHIHSIYTPPVEFARLQPTIAQRRAAARHALLDVTCAHVVVHLVGTFCRVSHCVVRWLRHICCDCVMSQLVVATLCTIAAISRSDLTLTHTMHSIVPSHIVHLHRLCRPVAVIITTTTRPVSLSAFGHPIAASATPSPSASPIIVVPSTRSSPHRVTFCMSHNFALPALASPPPFTTLPSRIAITARTAPLPLTLFVITCACFVPCIHRHTCATHAFLAGHKMVH